MKSSPSRPPLRRSPRLAGTVILASAALGSAALLASAELPLWMQTLPSASAIESALYRAMDLPGLRTLYPRPPAEARAQLDTLITAQPASAQLYALRAHAEEDQLDFTAAAQDWTAFVEHSTDKATANLQLADYFHRRNAAADEVAALQSAATVPTPPGQQFLPADQQTAWKTFPRAIAVAQQQALGDDAVLAIHRAWIARYPDEPSVYASLLAALLDMHRYPEAQRAIDAYHAAFPQDAVLPVKATALLAFDQGTPDATARALDLFDHAYQPLWPSDLIQTYFQLLTATRSQHAMLATARAQLLQNPDDLRAATRIFYGQQQQGHTAAAVAVLAQFAASKQSRHAAWTPDELDTFATLLDRTGQPEEAARYDFALAATSGKLTLAGQSPAEAGLTGLLHLLLSAPTSQIALGAGNLSVYRDLATTDQGPGYLNGVFSLWFNSATPASELEEEEAKATPYFHRAKAEALLSILDQQFPNAAARPALHAQLIEAYAFYNQDAAVRQAGRQFLADFPHAPQRLAVALQVADADARANDTHAEFALYDSLLAELAANLHGLPLTAASAPPSAPGIAAPPQDTAADPATDSATEPATDPATDTTPATPSAADLLRQSLTLPVTTPSTAADAQAYSDVLERYLGRLTATGQLPAALAVLRRELDRNPNDPRIYQRLADFLQQNDLAAQQEQVYRQAIARFPSTGFYDKLARFYISHQRQQDFHKLTRQVVDIFSGSDLEAYFANVQNNWPQEYLQLNLYAHQRFPHELAFTRNLLTAYRAKGTADPAAYNRLLREHWLDAPDLEAAFFDQLASSHQLDTELTALTSLVPDATHQTQDPAATYELAQIHLWQSHFEQGAPLLASLANQYPANTAIGDEAASVLRSLAYFDPTQLTAAVAIAKHLSAAQPTDLDRLATIGDIYANSTSSDLHLDAAAQLAQAAPFFRRIAAVHPGSPDGYLQSATVFWDYFQFDQALAQITAARDHLHQPALFAYQAGALYEGRRDYPHAVAEYTAASTATDQSSDALDARSRLLELATRSQFATLIDQASLHAATDDPSPATLQLRLDVLNAQHQPANIAPLVESAVAATSDPDVLATLATFARAHQLSHASQAALQRQVQLINDPVQRIEVQYQLVAAYEDAHDLAAAQHLIESVHTADPLLVGVVRSTVDFYWRNHRPTLAIATLLQAAHQANAPLALDYTLEAVSKSNDSGDFAGARSLLQPLLAAQPFNAKYLALQAQSYSLARNDAAVRDLYTATLAALNASSLDAATRRDDIALVRQAMIPALTQLHDYPGALNQHIALISAFPEDDALLQAAIAYARLHSLEPQLVGFLNHAVADSPRDSRFAIDLARVDAQFEDPAGALAAYSQAIAIRRDRTDLFLARADLEEHQQDFDAACADYARLYTLTYNDPQWMEKAALARARQGKPGLAVKALQTAWIDGRPPAAANSFRVAAQLEQWDLLAQADTFAQQGVQLAGADLLTNAQLYDGAVLYARLLARERKAPQALSFLTRQLQSVNTSPSAPTVVVQQVQQQGLASVTDSQWRKHLVAQRQQQATTTHRAALLQIASVVAAFYTPEEKLAFAALLDAQRANRPLDEVVDLWIPVAHAAGLFDRELAWRRDVLLHGGKLAAAQLPAFNTLARARLDDATRAQTLDAYALQLKPAQQGSVLGLAANAWRDAGALSRETADLRKLVLSHHQQQFQARLFDLYLHGDPSALLQLAASKDAVADSAANYLLAHGTQSLAYQAVAARGLTRKPVWTSLTAALTGLYFGDTSAPIDADFEAALGDATIADRLARQPDPGTRLTGDAWFYYGSRYGYFLTLAAQPAHPAEDYLPAELELAPDNPAAYSSLADVYLEAHQTDAAIAELSHAIELDPDDATPDVTIAEALWSAGRHDQAITQWNAALTKLRATVDVVAVPETFYNNLATIARDGHANGIAAHLQSGMGLVLAAYIRKNGTYRTRELLNHAYTLLDADDHQPAVAFVLSLIANARTPDRLTLLTSLTQSDAPWFPAADLDPVFQQALPLAREAAQSAPPDDYAHTRLANLQTSYITWLVQNHRLADARALLASLPAAQRSNPALQSLAVLLAAQLGDLNTLLSNYQTNPTDAPAPDTLATVAATLRTRGDLPNSRLLLEYVFQLRLQTQALTAADYLALAEARIATNDLPGALDLLRRLTFQGDLYANLDSAAALLERTHHAAEALPFLTRLANCTPWSAALRLRLAQAQLATQQPAAAETLTTVAANSQAPYTVRAAAATALTSANAALGSAELNALAAKLTSVAAAGQPYFLFLRIAAAATAAPAQRSVLLRAALKIAPGSMTDWLRLRVFQAELAQSRFELARAAVDPLLTQNASLWDTTANPTPGDDIAPPDPFSLAAALAEPADRRTILLQLGSLYEHLHNDAAAIQQLQSAAALTPSNAQRAPIEQRIRALQENQSLAQQNDARRPVIQPSLDQSVLVRRRLTSLSEVQP